MMKKRSLSLLPLLLAAALASNAVPVSGQDKECGEFGTAVMFANSPAEAAKQALKEEKLVFVLHVSGLFEESDFT